MAGRSSGTATVGAPDLLVVGPTDHPLEREANRIAELADGTAPDSARLHRPLNVGRTSHGPDGQAIATPANISRVLGAAGIPLSPSLRRDFEPRFGADFGAVRLHDDAEAAASAADLQARAYTVGNHIVFGAGQYASDHPAGRRLLAHELTHVMQGEPSALPVLRRESVDAPTFGNLPGHTPRALRDPNFRFRLRKEAGKWYEMLADGSRRPVSGSYDFVLQGEDIWAVRQPRKAGRGALGHTEAGLGKRGRFAGQMHFTEQSQELVRWDALSGHYRPERSARETLRSAGLSSAELEKFDLRAAEEAWAKRVEQAAAEGLPMPKKRGAQLAVWQPPGDEVLEARGRGGDRLKRGARTPEPIPQRTIVSGHFNAKPPPGGNKAGPGRGKGLAAELQAGKTESLAAKANTLTLAEEAAKAGKAGRAGKAARVALAAGKIAEALLPTPMDVLFLWIDFFGSLAEAKEKLRQEYYMRGFSLGVAARLLRLDAAEATRMLQRRTTPEIGEMVAGWEGVRDSGRARGVESGWRLWNKTNGAQREVLLQLRRGVVKAKRGRVGPDAGPLAFNFDDVLELAVILAPTMEQWLEAAAEEQRRQAADEEARRNFEFREATWRTSSK